jgi:DNA-directed RNA polymerase specialized sigma subunit
MITSPREPEAPRRARFVHLGDRLLAIGRIRSGAASVAAIADEFDIEPEDVMKWIDALEGERMVSLEELRDGDSPEMRVLTRRARQLAQLVIEADRLIRDLHQEYVLMLASKSPRGHQGI